MSCWKIAIHKDIVPKIATEIRRCIIFLEPSISCTKIEDILIKHVSTEESMVANKAKDNKAESTIGKECSNMYMSIFAWGVRNVFPQSPILTMIVPKRKNVMLDQKATFLAVLAFFEIKFLESTSGPKNYVLPTIKNW